MILRVFVCECVRLYVRVSRLADWASTVYGCQLNPACGELNRENNSRYMLCT